MVLSERIEVLGDEVGHTGAFRLVRLLSAGLACLKEHVIAPLLEEVTGGPSGTRKNELCISKDFL